MSELRNSDVTTEPEHWVFSSMLWIGCFYGFQVTKCCYSSLEQTLRRTNDSRYYFLVEGQGMEWISCENVFTPNIS